jgi:FixJ family two-component response regulator
VAQVSSDATVLIVDDDAAVREALCDLLESIDLQVRVFGSVAELLASTLPDTARCLVLDIRLPGMSGLDFQEELALANIRTPIIFMTGHGDIPMSVRAMKAGAVDFLTKPFRDQDMLDAIATAIAHDCKRRSDERLATAAHTLFESLTPREREVMTLVTKGMMNKEIAAELGLSVITVKVHRGQVMKKMGVRTLPDLVRVAESLGLHGSDARAA